MSGFAGNRKDWRAVVQVVAFLLFVTCAGFVLHHVYQRYVLLRYIDQARLHYLHVQPLGDRPLLPRSLHQQLPATLAPWFLATPREIFFIPNAGDEKNHRECLEWIDKYPLKSTARRCIVGIGGRTVEPIAPALRLLMQWPNVEWTGCNGESFQSIPRHNFAKLDIVLAELEELGFPGEPVHPDDKLRRKKLYARWKSLKEPYP